MRGIVVRRREKNGWHTEACLGMRDDYTASCWCCCLSKVLVITPSSLNDEFSFAREDPNRAFHYLWSWVIGISLDKKKKKNYHLVTVENKYCKQNSRVQVFGYLPRRALLITHEFCWLLFRGHLMAIVLNPLAKKRSFGRGLEPGGSVWYVFVSRLYPAPKHMPYTVTPFCPSTWTPKSRLIRGRAYLTMLRWHT